MDFRLTDEQELLKRSVREFAEAELRPHVREWDEAQHYPRDLLARCATWG
jgi:alkylation response protein AidB-like acyl-CoA dehydrogenase